MNDGTSGKRGDDFIFLYTELKGVYSLCNIDTLKAMCVKLGKEMKNKCNLGVVFV